MRVCWKGAFGICVLAALLAGVSAFGQAEQPVPPKTPPWLPDHDWSGQWCRYGLGGGKEPAKGERTMRTIIVEEVEPNDDFATAQVLTIEPAAAKPVDIDLSGAIDIGADEDVFRFKANKGDILGLAAVAESGSLDTWLSVEQISGTPLIENDDHGGNDYYYPPQSPFPAGVSLYDSALTWVAPAQGDYLIRVKSYYAGSRGDYTLKIRARRPSFEDTNLGDKQIVFFDFDGATINAQDIFSYYFARSSATLSPLRYFLPNWGLTWEDEAEVVQAILDNAEEVIDNLRLASLNGNRESDGTPGHLDIEILNSRDHADPWGQPNVSRVIIGGTIDQLGIPTIGIAQSIDPGNFAREETAVVLLDELSGPRYYEDLLGNQRLNPNSINAMSTSAGLTKIELIGQTIAHVAVHEMGHFMGGNWHTDNSNDVLCLMDKGGTPIWFIAGAGADATLGTADDEVVEFNIDVFDPSEYVAIGEQMTDVNTAFAFSSGKVSRQTVPATDEPEPPLASIRATPSAGSPPLEVQFFAGAVDPKGGEFNYVWDFGDDTPAGSGAVATHTFEQPGTYLVRLTATNLSTGNSGEATTRIVVSASLPTASVIATPTQGAAPLTVSFDASASTTPWGDIVAYEWDFGDGTTGTGATVQHIYASPGYYSARLTITDTIGGTSTALVLVNVTSPSARDAVQPSNNEVVPSANTAPAPQCGLSGGVMMLTSLIGLGLIRRSRRRY